MSATRKLRQRAAAEDRKHQAELHVPGHAQGRPRLLRGATRTDLRRGVRCHGIDPAHAGGIHGRGPEIQKTTGQVKLGKSRVGGRLEVGDDYHILIH
jgi:hypothetical protein